MIFVSVGSQMPFDRLVLAVDEWAGRTGRTDVFAQIGEGGEAPKHIGFVRTATPPEYDRLVDQADLMVSHAGTGVMLTALTHQKPILVMARRADLRETRNDHQRATIDRFRARSGIYAAADERELVAQLDQGDFGSGSGISPFASDELLRTVRAFIDN